MSKRNNESDEDRCGSAEDWRAGAEGDGGEYPDVSGGGVPYPPVTPPENPID